MFLNFYLIDINLIFLIISAYTYIYLCLLLMQTLHDDITQKVFLEYSLITWSGTHWVELEAVN